MINHKADKSHYFESAIFLVLFLLFISLFSNKSEKIYGDTFQQNTFSYAYLLEQVTALNDAQALPCPKAIVPFVVKANFNLLQDNHKIIAVNRSMHHNIQHFQKTEILIKPGIVHRFFYRYHAVDSDDFPVLS